MDGISGVAFDRLNGDETLRKSLKRDPTYNFTNIYGFDCSAHSFASIFLGKCPHELNILNYRTSKFLKYSHSIFDTCVSNETKSIYVTNNYVLNHGLFLNEYDHVIIEKEKYPLSHNIGEKINSIPQNCFVVIHDMYTHDQNGLYSKGKFEYTIDEYNDLIQEHLTKILPQTLESIGFNNKKDDLVLISDHGMTIGDINNPDIQFPWAFPSLDFKAKTICKIYLRQNTKKIRVTKPTTLLSVHQILTKLLSKQDIILSDIKLHNHISNLGNSALTKQNKSKLNQMAFFSNTKSNYFEKFIYQISTNTALKTTVIDGHEDNCVEIEYESLPDPFKRIIKNVSEISQHHWLSDLHNNFFNFGALRYYIKYFPSKLVRKLKFNILRFIN